MGKVVPGCAETFMDSPVFQPGEQFGEGQGQGQGFRDMHQKVEHLRCGDTTATPPGVAQWFYNNGNEPLILVAAADIANNQNQLDRNLRVSQFFLYRSEHFRFIWLIIELKLNFLRLGFIYFL